VEAARSKVMERELIELRCIANRLQSEVALLGLGFDDAWGNADCLWEEGSRLEKTHHETTLSASEVKSSLEEVNSRLEEAAVELSRARKEIGGNLFFLFSSTCVTYLFKVFLTPLSSPESSGSYPPGLRRLGGRHGRR
jgi:hypothetical protein